MLCAVFQIFSAVFGVIAREKFSPQAAVSYCQHCLLLISHAKINLGAASISSSCCVQWPNCFALAQIRRILHPWAVCGYRSKRSPSVCFEVSGKALLHPWGGEWPLHRCLQPHSVCMEGNRELKMIWQVLSCCLTTGWELRSTPGEPFLTSWQNSLLL